MNNISNSLTSKSDRINLVKSIASLMVVILHVIENGDGAVQLCFYLLGSFGIPLFFMLNGYLLYSRDITFDYIKKKVIRILRFVILWGISVGVIESIINHDALYFLKVCIGAFIGKSDLFHLWFLSALVIIYVFSLIINILLKNKGYSIQKIITKPVISGLILLLFIIFFVDIILTINGLPEIREIVPAPLRLCTNGSYFFIGMYIKKNEKLNVGIWGKIDILVFVICWLCVCMLAIKLHIVWASSYYDFIPVVFGSVILMKNMVNCSIHNDMFWNIAKRIAPTTTGIWILHPFIYKIANKCLIYFGLKQNIGIRIIEVVFIYGICSIITVVLLKNRILRKYVSM